MGRSKITDQQRLEKQIAVIGDEVGKKVISKLKSANIGPSDADPQYGPHTLLKLSYLNYYLGVFLRIGGYRKQRGRFDKIVFLDAFGGSGLVRIAGSKYAVLGSTILAATASSSGSTFDQVISIEIDHKRASLLRERCSILGLSNVVVIEGDSNNEVQLLPRKVGIGPKTIVMLFIDPEGMEPQFSRFLPLSQATETMDVMLNATAGVTRLDGRIKNNLNPRDLEKMKSFNPNYQVGDNSLESLIANFERDFGKQIGRTVEIHSIGLTSVYTLILRVRRTLNSSQWVEAMNKFGDFISSIDGQWALRTLQIVKGDQKVLFS